eukprot:g5545.t1
MMAGAGDVEIFEALPGGRAATLFETLSGGLAATIFSSIYVVAPLWLLAAPLLLIFYPWSPSTWVVVVPLVLSAVLPPMPSRMFLRRWPFILMPRYFDYLEIREIKMADIRSLVASRPTVFGVQPHGVFAFGGACAGTQWAKAWWNPKDIPTAAAASVMPRKGKSIVLYIGGIAELFLSSADKEVIFARKRKGFVKLALRTGAEIVPVYHFGNTTVLSVLNNACLRSFARRTGVSLTWFWGRWGTVIPRPRKLVVVIGRPLGMPAEPIAEPSQEQIDEWHTKYLDELTRIFEQWKKLNPDFKDKTLHFE